LVAEKLEGANEFLFHFSERFWVAHPTEIVGEFKGVLDTEQMTIAAEATLLE
jgi:hypothetical protein